VALVVQVVLGLGVQKVLGAMVQQVFRVLAAGVAVLLV
jgi:hypothetical protein